MNIHKLGYLGLFGGFLGVLLGTFVSGQYYWLCLLSLLCVFFLYPKKPKQGK